MRSPIVSLTEQAVALLAEGVGRNFLRLPFTHPALQSPSSRRAWVEMM